MSDTKFDSEEIDTKNDITDNGESDMNTDVDTYADTDTDVNIETDPDTNPVETTPDPDTSVVTETVLTIDNDETDEDVITPDPHTVKGGDENESDVEDLDQSIGITTIASEVTTTQPNVFETELDAETVGDEQDTVDETAETTAPSVEPPKKKKKRKESGKHERFGRNDYHRFDLTPTEPTDYAQLLLSVSDRLRSLDSTNLSDSTELNSLVQDIETVRSRVQLTQDIGKNFIKKDQMLCAFTESAKSTHGIMITTQSAYDRKYVECPRGLVDLFEDGVFGNPIGCSIDFVFRCPANEFLEYMSMLKSTTYRDEASKLRFGNYRLDEVQKIKGPDPNLNFPNRSSKKIRFKMVMTDMDTGTSILSYASESGCRNEHKTRAEDIDYTGKQVFKSIHDLSVKRAILTYDLYSAIKKLKGTMVREARAQILMRVVQTMEETARLLDEGYRYVDIGHGRMIKFNIERDEMCPITAQEPPYINIHLECGHTLSLSAFRDIVVKGVNSATESIRCPFDNQNNLIPGTMRIFSGENKKHASHYNLKIISNEDLKETPIDTSGYTLERPPTCPNALFTGLSTDADDDTYVPDPTNSGEIGGAQINLTMGTPIIQNEIRTELLLDQNGRIIGTRPVGQAGPGQAMNIIGGSQFSTNVVNQEREDSSDADDGSDNNDSDNENDEDGDEDDDDFDDDAMLQALTGMNQFGGQNQNGEEEFSLNIDPRLLALHMLMGSGNGGMGMMGMMDDDDQ